MAFFKILALFGVINVSVSANAEYDSDFEVTTNSEHTVAYNKENKILSVYAPDGSIVVSGTPKYTSTSLHGLGGPTDRLFIFEIFGDGSTAKFTIFRYYREANIPESTRKARLVVKNNGATSRSWASEVQEFWPEERRRRYSSFSVQTTLGGLLTYDNESRQLNIYDSSGEIVNSGTAFYRSNRLVGFSNATIEEINTFEFEDEVSGEKLIVHLGFYPGTTNIRSSYIKKRTPEWYRVNTKIAELFNIDFSSVPSPISAEAPVVSCKDLLI